MSEEYVIVFVETNPPRGFGQRFRDSEELPPGCALIVGPPEAQAVAKTVCEALNRDVDFKRNEAIFEVKAAASLLDSFLVECYVDIENYANYSGRADSEDRTSRGAAYHRKARALEAAVRERLGLVCAGAVLAEIAQSPPESESGDVAQRHPADAQSGSAGDTPEDASGNCPDAHGFVKCPADKTAYLPAIKVLNDHTRAKICTTAKQLRAILDKHPEIKRWNPSSNRLNIHLADWELYVKTQEAHPGKVDPDELTLRNRAASIRTARFRE